MRGELIDMVISPPNSLNSESPIAKPYIDSRRRDNEKDTKRKSFECAQPSPFGVSV